MYLFVQKKKTYTELGISALQQEQFALQEQAIIDRFFILYIFVHLYHVYTNTIHQQSSTVFFILFIFIHL
jgi:hypothetical protein